MTGAHPVDGPADARPISFGAQLWSQATDWPTFRDAGLADDPAAKRGITWLLANQNDDGSWGGLKDSPSSVEETALATEILCGFAPEEPGTQRGVKWLIQAVESGSYREPSPIGFYFAKLWYFEKLYPIIFTVAALGRAVRRLA